MMKIIKNPNTWLKGKTIKKVDTKSVNCNIFEFTDGTGVYLEAEPAGCGIYTPVWYEIDPKIPIEQQ